MAEEANLAAWKEFYVGAVTIAVVVFGVSLFGLAGIWVLFPIGSFLLVVLLGIYYRMVGRLLGCVANEIDPVTGAKISQS